MKPSKLVYTLMTALLILSFAGTPVIAEEYPPLGLKTLQGKPASLDQWVGKGKWVLVMFWAVHCKYCEMNKPAINAFYAKHKNRDATVVGVSIDGMAQIDAIRNKLRQAPTKFPNYVADLSLMALNYEIAALEPFRGTPTYWFFSPRGELKAVNPGPVRVEALEAYMARFSQR